MLHAARAPLALLVVLAPACSRPPEPAPARPEPAPAPGPGPAAAPAVEPAAPTHCTIAAGNGDEQSALAAWLARKPVPEGFSCPPVMRVVQREPWYVADGELANVENDDLGGPARRTSVGERVFFWGVEPASGDSLLVSLGRVDASSLAAVKQRLAGEPEGLHEPDFEDEQRRLDGSWRGLAFVARPAAVARKLRAWLAELPAGTAIESYPIDWERAIDEDELPALPRLVHARGESASTLCIETVAKRGCWSTSPVEIDLARSESLDDEPAGGASADSFPAVELTVWTGRRLEQWRLDPAGTWTVASGANTRRGRLRPIKSDRRFEAAAVAPFRGEFPNMWVRSLGVDWLAAGGFGSGSQGLVRDAAWIFRRSAPGWQFAALDGDDVSEHFTWPDGQTIGVVLGSHERIGGDGLASADGRLWAFTVEGEWLRPAGKLPLPVRGMSMLRTAGGWEYEYSLTPRPPRCLAVALARSVYWRTDDYGDNRRDFAMSLPMASLRGAWSLAADGFVPGC